MDIIALGCPHYSAEQLRRVAYLIKGKKVVEGIELWIFTSRMAEMLARRMGIVDVIKKAGGRVVTDTCILYFPLEQWCFETLMTDSAKMAYYIPGLTKIDVIFKNTEECMKTATGED